jgi:hypothetical protein
LFRFPPPGRVGRWMTAIACSSAWADRRAFGGRSQADSEPRIGRVHAPIEPDARLGRTGPCRSTRLAAGQRTTSSLVGQHFRAGSLESALGAINARHRNDTSIAFYTHISGQPMQPSRPRRPTSWTGCATTPMRASRTTKRASCTTARQNHAARPAHGDACIYRGDSSAMRPAPPRHPDACCVHQSPA